MNYRYEPTRYVIVASHHDSWHKGAARPGIGHAVLMELVRTLGYEAKHGWRPGLHKSTTGAPRIVHILRLINYFKTYNK